MLYATRCRIVHFSDCLLHGACIIVANTYMYRVYMYTYMTVHVISSVVVDGARVWVTVLRVLWLTPACDGPCVSLTDTCMSLCCSPPPPRLHLRLARKRQRVKCDPRTPSVTMTTRKRINLRVTSLRHECHNWREICRENWCCHITSWTFMWCHTMFEAHRCDLDFSRFQWPFQCLNHF